MYFAQLTLVTHSSSSSWLCNALFTVFTPNVKKNYFENKNSLAMKKTVISSPDLLLLSKYESGEALSDTYIFPGWMASVYVFLLGTLNRERKPRWLVQDLWKHRISTLHWMWIHKENNEKTTSGKKKISQRTILLKRQFAVTVSCKDDFVHL